MIAVADGLLVVLGLLVVASSAGRPSRVALGSACAVFFATLLVGFVRHIRERRPLLVFTEDGVVDASGEFALGQVSWERVRRVQASGPRLKIQIAPNAGTDSARLLRRILRFLWTGSTDTTIAVTRFVIRIEGDLGQVLSSVAARAIQPD